MNNVKSLQNTINQLISLGLPPLPIAPAQPAEDYPARNKDKDKSVKLDKQGNPLSLFTGKNPSWVDPNGKPHLINHRQYQNQLPSAQELELWFSNPLNGIGTLGWWNNWIPIDFDVKNFDGNKEACKEAAFETAAKYLEITGKDALLQESHSGGWHVWVRVKQKPNFTNFALSPGGKHVGEALGEGHFCVLAPTVGPSGNPYKIHQWGDPEGIIDSLDQIGIYSTKSPKEQVQKPSTSPVFSVIPGSTPLNELISNKNQGILNGDCPSGDRSQDIATLLNDAYGWVKWANENEISISGSPGELAHQAGVNHGIDSDRIERIIKSIKVTENCNPAAFYRGEDKSCWMKIYRLDRASFDAKCPAEIKESIRLEWQQRQVETVREATTGGVVTAPSTQKVVSGNFKAFGNGGSGKNFSEDVHSLVKELVTKGLPEDKFQAEIIELASISSYSVYDLSKLARSIEAAESKKEILNDDKNEFDILSKYHKQKFDLFKVFPHVLAEALRSKAEADRLDHALVYAYLIAGSASSIGAEIAVIVKEGLTSKDHWREFLQIWAAIVGEPSIGKSQAARALLSPLKQKQLKIEEEFSHLKKELAKKKKNWDRMAPQQREQLKGTKEDPQRLEDELVPPPTKLIESGTPEACFKRLGENKDKTGVLFHFDELKRMMLLDQYKSGDGDTRQLFLDSWGNPFSMKMHRVNDENSYSIKNQCISIIGGIQPAILRRLATDSVDGDGLLSRFLFINAQIHENFSIWSDMKVGIAEPITALYEKLGNLASQLRKIANLPVLDENNEASTVDVILSPEAKQLYIKMWEKLHRHMEVIKGEDPAIFGYLGKMASQIPRLALLFHCIRVALGEADNPLEISQETMESAIYAAEYHIGQYRLILSKTDENGVPAELIKIQEYLERRSGKEISAEKIQRTVFRHHSKKPPLADIRQWMKQIAEWSGAIITGVGSKLRIIFEKGKDFVIAKNYDENCDTSSEPINNTQQGVQALEEKICDNCDQSPEPEFTHIQELVEDISTDDADLPIENHRKSRNSLDEEASIPYVETFLDDSEMLEFLSQEVRNCDDQSENEDDPDDDPDNDPPGGGIEPIAFTSDDEPVFEGSFAVVESEEAPHEWKLPMLWFVAKVSSNIVSPNEVLVECQPEPDIGSQTMPLKWLRLLSKEEIPIHMDLLAEALASAKSIEVGGTQAKSLKGRRIKCGEFIGTLVDKVSSGWITKWENCKSTLKRFGNPPEYLQDGEFEFI